MDVKDLLESSIVTNASTISQKLRNAVFQHFLNNRDALGFPKGCASYPYFILSNDLCGIVINFLKLVHEASEFEGRMEILEDVPNMFDMLIQTYDETCCHGCCGPWHSMEKDEIVALKSKLIMC
jgi:hypothetical protein